MSVMVPRGHVDMSGTREKVAGQVFKSGGRGGGEGQEGPRGKAGELEEGEVATLS